MVKFNSSIEKTFHLSTPDTKQSKYNYEIFRESLRGMVILAAALTITSCGEKSKESLVDPVLQQQEVEIQNNREITQKKLKEKKLELKNLQAQIDKTENQDERLKLVVEFDELKSKYRDYFAGLSFEDREYFKNRIHLIN